MLGKKVPEKFQGKSFVYFITELPFRNRYKIGLTESKTSNRIDNLQTGSSDELAYDFIVPVSKLVKVKQIEHLFHEFYASVRRSINGKPTEWFDLTTSEAYLSRDAFNHYKDLYIVDRVVNYDGFRDVLFLFKFCSGPGTSHMRFKPFDQLPSSAFTKNDKIKSETKVRIKIKPKLKTKPDIKPDIKPNTKPDIKSNISFNNIQVRRKVIVKPKPKSPIVIDLTVDDTTTPEQNKDFILNMGETDTQSNLMTDINQTQTETINDIVQKIEIITFGIKNLSLQ